MISVKATNGTVTLSLSAGLERFEAERPRIYREIGQSLLVNIRQGFEAEHSPEGEAWEPLKPATVRQRKGDAHPILQRKGRLKKTITWKVGPDSVIVGTNLVYAAVHQFGATINRAAGATKLHFRVTVNRAAGATKLHFRRISRGKNKGQVRFAKATDKRAKFGMATAAHTIRIPARPYLFQRDGGIPDGWKAAIVGIVMKHMQFDHA